MNDYRNDIGVMLPAEAVDFTLKQSYIDRETKLAKDRCFYIEGEIDDEMLETVKEIQLINKADADLDIPIEERQPIKLFIFSEGGDLYVTYSIISMIEASETPVYTYNMGISFSAAALILMAGQKRYCLKRSEALIHRGSGTASGTYGQLTESVDSYKRMIARMQDYILEKTKIEKKELNKKKDADWYLTDAEQVEKGLVDEIISDIDLL